VLKKELITTHPRRIYFYLTTSHHQPIPKHEAEIVIPRRGVASPALSEDEDEEENRRRSEMSPSPEVDLSSHELDDGDDAGSDTNSSLSSTTASMIDRQRTRSPSTLQDHRHMHAPLEGDEREFSQSAIYMDRRSRFRNTESKKEATSSKRGRAEYETDHEHEHGDERTYEDAVNSLLSYATVTGDTTTFSSPNLASAGTTTPIKREDVTSERHIGKVHHADDAANPTLKAELYSWNGEFERHLGSPESVDLDELDGMLDF
jgi:hypothetical protein